MKTIIFIILALSVLTDTYGQCQRNTPFTADFIFQFSGQRLNSSLNFGFFNTTKVSVQAGARMYDTPDPGKANEQKVHVTPAATVLIKQRFNGEYSKLVHSLGVTVGTNNYREASYRLYGAPDGNSFATVGGLVSHSNLQGITIGFVIMAIF